MASISRSGCVRGEESIAEGLRKREKDDTSALLLDRPSQRLLVLRFIKAI